MLEKPLHGTGALHRTTSDAHCVHGTPFAARRSNTPRALQIDGFTVTGADTGGGIVANGNAYQLQISNNRIVGNQGLYNGGIRIGHADLLDVNANTGIEEPVDTRNLLVNIHHNEIVKNGNTAGETSGGGGGISIYTGAHGYRVANNYISGNFSTGDGGGMAHFGRSSGLRHSNSNNRPAQDNSRAVEPMASCRPSRTTSSASTSRSTRPSRSRAAASRWSASPTRGPDNGVTLGTGSLVILNNVIEGNLAGAGDGGGIALVGVNGTGDVTSRSMSNWNRVDILGNVITNNGTGVSGGGISLQDSANVHIVNSTVSNNDSFATAARAFQGGTTVTQANNLALLTNSVLQDGAGITAYAHSQGLRALIESLNGGSFGSTFHRYFSDAEILNSVVMGNRSRSWCDRLRHGPGHLLVTTPGETATTVLRPQRCGAAGPCRQRHRRSIRADHGTGRDEPAPAPALLGVHRAQREPRRHGDRGDREFGRQQQGGRSRRLQQRLLHRAERHAQATGVRAGAVGRDRCAGAAKCRSRSRRRRRRRRRRSTRAATSSTCASAR